MKIRKILVSLMLAVLLAAGMSGCVRVTYPNLPDDAIAFHMDSYTDPNDKDAEYAAITYRGRTYLPYGTSSSSFRVSGIAACVGYIRPDDDNASDLDNTDERVYTLTEDPDCNYLVIYDVGIKLMNQPDFWRAADTMQQEIDTPDCIDSLNYAVWE